MSLSASKISFHCLLSSVISEEKSMLILLLLFPYIYNVLFFSSCFQNFFSLSLIFYNLIMMCLGLISLNCSCLRFCDILDSVNIYFLIKFRYFLSIFFLNIFLHQPFSPFATPTFNYFILSHRFQGLLFLFFLSVLYIG